MSRCECPKDNPDCCRHSSSSGELVAILGHAMAALVALLESIIGTVLLLYLESLRSLLLPWLLNLACYIISVSIALPAIFALWHLWSVFEHQRARRLAADNT